MDRISDLPDELLLKVLLFLPTKIAVRTSGLSKRWEFLWMWLPKLEYNDNKSSECKNNLQSFLYLNFPLHKAPIIETLRLTSPNECGASVNSEDITLWVVIVASRGIRELSLNLYSLCSGAAILPSSLYTCKSLVVLKLTEGILVDVPRMAYLPSLKTLFLESVLYSNENSLQKLLSSCPILEHLVVERRETYDCGYDRCEALSIIVPSLERLILRIHRRYYFDRLLINTPSLKCFKVIDYRREYYDSDNERDNDDDRNSYSLECNDMPKLEEADFDSEYPDIHKFFRSIKYVKRLSLCISVTGAEEALYQEGITVFNQLQHLKLCSCVSYWPKLLVRLLKDSPNLRELEVNIFEGHSYANPILSLENQLNPGYLFSSLETFKWTGIYGTYEELVTTKYILRHACCLKIATILFQTPIDLEEDYKVAMAMQELSLSFLGSKTCQLVFGEK